MSLDIFAFNDTHGNVKDTEGKGIGIAKTTTLLKEISSADNSIFISQGDMWQGSVESNYTRGNLVTEWMNSMNFVSMTVGNHEFDWGTDVIKQNSELANFPTLGINVLNRSNNQIADFVSPSTTFIRSGAKIGVIGAIGDCYGSISGSRVKDVYFAQGDTLTNMVKQESTRLRNEEKCDFIIYSIHGAGDRDEDDRYDISLSSGHYVDLVLEGHTHADYCYQDSYNIYHIQSYAYNQEFYKITVNLDLTNSSFTVTDTVSYDTRYSGPYRNYAEDTAVNALFTKYYDKYAFAYEPIGNVSTRKYPTELKSKIADLYLEAGLKKWNNQYDVLLGGGYISCRGSYLEAGQVLYTQLNDLFPFDNDIVLCSISGYYLKNTSFYTLENSNYYVTWSSYGNSVKDSINDYSTYYVVTDQYSLDFTQNHLTYVDTYDFGVYARDLLKDYIAAGNWYDAPSGHEGTAEDPRTVAEALEYAYTHPGSSAYNAGSLALYYKGVVSRQAAYVSGQGDMSKVYIKDEGTDNEIMIYYLKKTQNNSGSTWTDVNELQLGDELIVCGKAFYFNSTTPELDNSTWVYSINGVRTA